MLIQNIGQIAINVKDLSRATAFYRDMLGLRHLFDAGPHMSFFDCGGVRLLLEIARDPLFDHPSSIIYFRVADIAASCQAMTAKGSAVRTETSPHRTHARSRFVDGVFPRPGKQSAGVDERSQTWVEWSTSGTGASLHLFSPRGPL